MELLVRVLDSNTTAATLLLLAPAKYPRRPAHTLDRQALPHCLDSVAFPRTVADLRFQHDRIRF